MLAEVKITTMGNKCYYIIDTESQKLISKPIETLEEAKRVFEQLHNRNLVIVETVFG